MKGDQNMTPPHLKIDWAAVTGECADQVRPETRAKYFPRNPLRQFILRRFLSRLASLLQQFSWQNLLDLGCGEGLVDYYLRLHFPHRLLTALDPDPAALRVAQKINPSIQYLIGDGRGLPFADHSFDAVICLEVLEHLPDFPRLLAEVRRVSRGHCLFSVPAFPFYQASNFLIGKNWTRLGEHPHHVVRFSATRLRRELSAFFPGPLSVSLSFPWLLALAAMPPQQK